jgi:predicted DCC family thiol-disulfide oxidoreductase YuxK
MGPPRASQAGPGAKPPDTKKMRGRTVVFYDGVCGLCNRFTQFLLVRDRVGRIAFAPLQGPNARARLPRYGVDPADLDTVYAIADWDLPGERVYARAPAVLYALRQLGGAWSLAARLAGLVPRPIADAIYDLIARRRYRVFGRYDTCPLPKPEWQGRFME